MYSTVLVLGLQWSPSRWLLSWQQGSRPGPHLQLCCLSDGERLQLQDEEDDSLCRICMDAVIDCVLLECGHMVTCTKCGKRMSECPICRQYVVRAVHVFKS